MTQSSTPPPPSPAAPPRPRRVSIGLIITIVWSLGISGVLAYLISGGGPQPIASSPPQTLVQAAAVVTIHNYSFNPAIVVIRPGQTVVWVNKDTPIHTVSSDSNAWASSDVIPGQRFAVRLTRPGVYQYACQIHPSMHGTVIVRAGGTAIPATAPEVAATGSVAGVVIDAATGRAVAHSLILADYTRSGLVAETDGQGLYVLNGVPAGRPVEVIAVASGHAYSRGYLPHLSPGVTVRHSFVLAAQGGGSTAPWVRQAGLYAGPPAGSSATEAHVTPGGLISAVAQLTPGLAPRYGAIIAASPQLGRLIWLRPSGRDRYSGSIAVPAATPPGYYTFRLLALGAGGVAVAGPSGAPTLTLEFEKATSGGYGYGY